MALPTGRALRPSVVMCSLTRCRHSTGDRAKTGNAQLAGSFGPQTRLLRGYPQKGDLGLERTNVYKGEKGSFGRSGTKIGG